jgi:hypothetical protein
MAINIKEILTTDSDVIKVDKTNYNFDQLTANGGGPIGIKGQKGELGGIGTTGAKGEKGDQGAKGDTGATGADVNNWGRISYDSATDADILKPKRDTNTDEPVSIILGDEDYEDGGDVGINSPTAWLNIVLPDSSKYSNYASFLNSTSSVLNLSSSTQSGVDTYQITHGDSTNSVDFKIDIKNSLYLNAIDLVQITSNTAIKLNAANNNITLGPDTGTSSGQIDLRADSVIARGNLTVEGTSTGYIKVPNGNTANRPTGAYGMIRYNTNLNVGHSSKLGSLETFVQHPDGDYWKPLGNMVDADGDTFITVDYAGNDGTDNVIRLNVGYLSGGSYLTEVVGTFGETIGDGTTDLDRVFTYNNVIYATDGILVPNDSGLRIRESELVAGASQVAAENSGAAAANRTLADYFYRESALQYDVDTFTTVQTGDVIVGVATDANDRYSNDVIIAHAYNDTGGNQRARANVAVIINHNNTRMSYVKVGHMVNVWGRIDMYAKSIVTGKLTGTDVNLSGISGAGGSDLVSPSRRAGFKIGGVDHFPYVSALTQERVVFPIAINPHDASDASAGLTKRYFGVIFPGMNVFNIVEADDESGALAGTDIESGVSANYLDIDDLITTSTSTPIITIDYNFSMPVDENSYDLGSNSYATYTENAPSAQQQVQ